MDKLAHRHPCRFCEADVYVVICADGFWRCFDATVYAPAGRNVWAWRKRRGMEEQDLVPGHRLHFCPQYDNQPTRAPELLNPWLVQQAPVEPEPEAPAPPAPPSRRPARRAPAKLDTLAMIARMAPPPPPPRTIPLSDETYLPSPDVVENARSAGGGWTQSTLAAWGVPWPPPPGWREDLERRWREAQHRQ